MRKIKAFWPQFLECTNK